MSFLGSPNNPGSGGSTNIVQATAGATAVVTTNETVLATTPALYLFGQTVHLNGYVDLTTAAGTTTAQVYIRRGATIGGPQVQRVQATVTAGNRIVVPIAWSDAPGAQAAQYCITVAAVGATANGSANSSSLTATY